MNAFYNLKVKEDENNNITEVVSEFFKYNGNGKMKKERKIRLVIGNEYIVQPDDPAKEKHRDRKCVIRQFITNDSGTPQQVQIKFLDNNRVGKADIHDLKLVK
jgi:hypothetical protein